MVFAFAGDSTTTRLPPVAALRGARFGGAGVTFLRPSFAATVLLVFGIPWVPLVNGGARSNDPVVARTTPGARARAAPRAPGPARARRRAPPRPRGAGGARAPTGPRP